MIASVIRGLALLVALLPFTAHAGVLFHADLLTSNEPSIVGPTTSTGDPRAIPFGDATFFLIGAGPTLALSMDATIFNIDVTGTQTPDPNDDLLAAHIHVFDMRGPTAPVRWGFFGMPFNDLQPPTIVVTPFTAGVGGRFTSVWNATEGNPNNGAFNLMSLESKVLNELAYINFHTRQNPGGEIRGELLVVPEPPVLPLLGLVAAALIGVQRARSGGTRPA